MEVKHRTDQGCSGAALLLRRLYVQQRDQQPVKHMLLLRCCYNTTAVLPLVHDCCMYVFFTHKVVLPAPLLLLL